MGSSVLLIWCIYSEYNNYSSIHSLRTRVLNSLLFYWHKFEFDLIISTGQAFGIWDSEIKMISLNTSSLGCCANVIGPCLWTVL